MAADVEEDMGLALLVAGDEQGDAKRVVRDRAVGVREQGGRRDDLRQAVEQSGLLRREAGRIGIDRGGDSSDRLADRILAGGDGMGEGELAFGGPLPGRHIHGPDTALYANVRQAKRLSGCRRAATRLG